jgi:ABC-type glycerol-3-phosphate transport system permease component
MRFSTNFRTQIRDRGMPTRRRKQLLRALSQAGVWLAVLLALIWTLFPIWWALVSSIKPERDVYRTVLLPYVDFTPTFAHWRWEWANRADTVGLADGVRNSLLVGLGTAACCVALGLLTAVGLRAFRTAAEPRAVIALLLMPRVVPAVVLLTPLLLLATALRVNDTRAGLVAVHTCLALPVAVLVIDAAVREIPADILAAAVLDGASPLEILRRFVVPLTAPVLWAVGILSFALSWNEFLFAVSNASRNATTVTISVAFLDQRDGVDFEHVGSHIVLIILLPLALAALTQRVLVRGLALGAVKG